MTGKGELTELLLSKPLKRNKLMKYGFSKNLDVVGLILFARAFSKFNLISKSSPIYFASFIKCKSEIVDLLLQEGWDANGIKGDPEPPIWTALIRGNIPAVQLLIRKGADINYKNKGATLMGAALFNCNEKEGKNEQTCIACAKLLLNAGISVNAVVISELQETALHLAAFYNKKKLLEFLIQNGADLNSKDSSGYTALHIATEENHLRCMKILMQNGVDLYVENNNGDTALTIAVLRHLREATKTLYKEGFNVNRPSHQGKSSALIVAVRMFHLELVKLLLALGADPNLQLKIDSTPLYAVVSRNLHICCREDKTTLQLRKDIAELLIEKGQNLNNPGNDVNPLVAAIDNGFIELAKLLVRLGANVNIRFISEDTLFHRVVCHNKDIIQLFLEYGGDYNSHNHIKQTPYNLAILKRVDLKFVKCFIKFGCPYDQNLNELKNQSKMFNWETDSLFTAEKRFFQGIKENNLSLVKAAVEGGAVVNGCCEEIKYPVHFLAFHGYDRLLHFLLENGVSPNMLNEQGESALYVAAKLGHYDCCCTLLKFGACYNYSYKTKFKDWVKSENVATLLQNVHKMFTITRVGNKKVISVMENLINNNINEYLIYANAVNYRGDSLLSTALRKNFTSIAREFMKLRIKYKS